MAAYPLATRLTPTVQQPIGAFAFACFRQEFCCHWPVIRACKAGYTKNVSLAVEVVLFLLIGCGPALTQTPPPMGPNFAWAKAFTSSAGGSAVKGVAVDSKGDVYIGGEFYSGAELNIRGVVLTNHDAQDGFLAKMDRQGNLVWVKQITGSEPDGILSVAVDAYDFVYALGASRSAAFRFGETNLTGQGDTDFILAKLDAAGNFAG